MMDITIGSRYVNWPIATVIIVLAALLVATGNCSCLGFGRDYVGDMIDCQKGGGDD